MSASEHLDLGFSFLKFNDAFHLPNSSLNILMNWRKNWVKAQAEVQELNNGLIQSRNHIAQLKRISDDDA